MILASIFLTWIIDSIYFTLCVVEYWRNLRENRPELERTTSARNDKGA